MNHANATALHRNPDTQRHPWGTITWLAGNPACETAGTTLGRVRIDPGKSNPCHRHNRCEEVLHLLAGCLKHTLGDEEFTVSAGDTLVIPAGVNHQAINNGTETADMMVAYNNNTRDFIPADQ